VNLYFVLDLRRSIALPRDHAGRIRFFVTTQCLF